MAFFSSIILVALLLLTPINTIARTQLFSVHAVQIVILSTFCAPLLLAACSTDLLRSLLKQPLLQGLTHPLVASLLFNIAFVLWHIPPSYNAAMADATLYHVQVFSLFLLSLPQWWPLVGAARTARAMSYPLRMLYAFLDGQPVGIFAMVMVFVVGPIYSHYALPPQLGITPTIDQIIAGGIFLVSGLVDIVVMSVLFVRWLVQIERHTRLEDAQRQEEQEELLCD